MSIVPIICYHGSPGLPDDFSLLEKYLPAQQIRKVVRNGYGSSDQPTYENDTNERILLGYSWGSVDVINDAAKNTKNVKGIILVSPYLFPEHKPSMATRALLKTPIVSDLVLTAIGAKIISKMLVNTSSPCPVPLVYAQTAKQLASPRKLKRAALEKAVERSKVQNVLKKLDDIGIPIAVIWGSDDIVSRYTEQINPLRKYIRFTHEKQLPKAGHAIIWTHPEAVASFVKTFLHTIDKSGRS